MLLLALQACLPLPLPDIRRPATFLVFSGDAPADLRVEACTWSTRHSPLEGCENLASGMPAVDGIGVPEWDAFPLVLRTESPMWGDIFVACEGDTPRGATLRLSDLQVKWDAKVEIVLDAPPTVWGEPPAGGPADAVVGELMGQLCAGTASLRE